MMSQLENDAPGRLRHYQGVWSYTVAMGTAPLEDLSSVFQEKWGYAANGHAWQAVIEGYMRTRYPEDAARLRYDSEADMFCVRCNDVEPLKRIAQILRRMLEHPEELRATLQQIRPD
jgi:hypothetical protein